MFFIIFIVYAHKPLFEFVRIILDSGFKHAWLALSARNEDDEHPLLVMSLIVGLTLASNMHVSRWVLGMKTVNILLVVRDVIIWISCSIKKSHGRKNELLRHIHHAHLILELEIYEASLLDPRNWGRNPRNLRDHVFELLDPCFELGLVSPWRDRRSFTTFPRSCVASWGSLRCRSCNKS